MPVGERASDFQHVSEQVKRSVNRNNLIKHSSREGNGDNDEEAKVILKAFRDYFDC